MKSESLVIADQHAAVNTFPGLVYTARHTMGVVFTRSRLPNRKEGAYHGELHDWGEVLTRYPYRKARLVRFDSTENPSSFPAHYYGLRIDARKARGCSTAEDC